MLLRRSYVKCALLLVVPLAACSSPAPGNGFPSEDSGGASGSSGGTGISSSSGSGGSSGSMASSG
ncbi:MAG: hypothetical protein M3O46_21275, partial [Myxococcota bacterium]|nr:hypothetical protein [Myxococcota bacterium]